MRVLVIIDSLAVGGAERSLAAVAPFLIEGGIDMHVAYLLDRPGVDADLRQAGVKLYSLSGARTRAGSVLRALRLIRQIRPDLVHTTLFEADVIGRPAGWFLGVPVVSSFVSESYGPEHIFNPEYRPWKVRGVRLADMITARLVTRFHAVSANAADLMARRLRIRRSSIDVIPRGRDPQELGYRSPERRQATRAHLGLADDVPVILGVGRHFYVKGLDLLIEAFPAVVAVFPKARLLIAGRDGPATEDLKRLISENELDGSVTLLGFRTDVPDLMCAADLFAFSSRSEGSPGVLLEAMALGTPVVASDIPSVREVAGVEAPTMTITALGSTEDMAAAIIGLLQDDGRAGALTRFARLRFLDKYTIDAVADATIELYERSVSTRGEG